MCVKNLVLRYNRMFENLYKKKKIEIYNIGSGKKTLLINLLKILKKKFQKKQKKYKFKILNRNLNPYQIEYSYCSNDKIKKKLKFKFTKLEEGIVI